MPETCIVGKTFRFEAAHSLPQLEQGHKCRGLHGHSYKVLVEIEGHVDAHGFVVDFNDISKAMKPIIDKLDHSNLNDIFAQASTAENIAIWIAKEVKNRLGRCKRVSVWETVDNVAIFETE